MPGEKLRESENVRLSGAFMVKKIRSKQYITVDNSSTLLYTVYRKGDNTICILY